MKIDANFGDQIGAQIGVKNWISPFSNFVFEKYSEAVLIELLLNPNQKSSYKLEIAFYFRES